ncbi:MAG: MFS transporter [Alicyclobacillaceae bacterium]|uniref:MFS transporter n=1 Tax=Alicyclobacillus sp. SP_1 TaxID=2942475 RepID=UPI00215727B8|nr:MFS transporter [Alicyclobacillus sp. SP_1]MCY0887718.1 MFS transporter [Alicyclobacillaceae bacterium]MCY0895415.1 MFS transporter [Alicyclobacillaceae bacterium]
MNRRSSSPAAGEGLSWQRTLIILWIANFGVMAGMNLVIPFLPIYIGDLGIHNLAQLERWSSWIFAAQFLTSFAFQPIWGAVADRRGRKIMLLRAGFGMGAMTALMGLVGAPWELLILRFVNGIFSGFISMAISLQASVTPEDQAGRALGILQTGGIAGGLIGPLLGGVLSEAFGIRLVFLFTGGMLFVTSIVVLFFVKEPKHPKVLIQRPKLSVWTLRPLLPVFLASFVTQLGVMSIEPIVTVFTKTIYHGGHLQVVAGLVVALSGFANLIGSPLLGRYSDKVGQKRILIVALCGAALMYVPQALAHTIGLLLIGRFLLGLFIGGMLPSLNVLVRKMAPQEMQAMAFGLNSSATFLGNLVGPLLGGMVAASYGIRSVFYVTMSVLVLNAIVLVFNRTMNHPEPIRVSTVSAE